MQDPLGENLKVLITGGTSGLGLHLVKIFLEKGYYVVTTGRRPVSFPEHEDSFFFYRTDFSDLGMTSEVFLDILRIHQFDLVINNAGILSPGTKVTTRDGHECTFQVNFLAHFMINEMILKAHSGTRPLRIVSVTSPVYKIARIPCKAPARYSAVDAYSESKLFLALLSSHLHKSHDVPGLTCFSFDPGVFGSGIYRMRGAFFRLLYHIAAPFMRKPSKVAAALYKIISEGETGSGVICNSRGRISKIPPIEMEIEENFWRECSAMIERFVNKK